MKSGFNTLMLKIFEKCAGNSGCEVCRLHMEDDCLFFPELYCLHDLARDSGTPLSEMDLRPLIHLCTLCGICPCHDIKEILLQAKAALSQEETPALSGRILCDAEMIGLWGTRLSSVLNPLNRLKPVQSIVRKTLKINPERGLPAFPKKSFFLWAKKRGLTAPLKDDGHRPKVAYFAGCSAGYLFPEVGKATVGILERNGIPVYVPPQNCCGMPPMMEGDQKTALKKIRANTERLWRCLRDGYDIVCSCPTCGYFFKKTLPEKAYYSNAFQEKAGSGNKVMKVPLGSGDNKFTTLPKGTYQTLLKDDGYFSAIDPLIRIDISLNVKDMGEYLLSLQAEGKLDITPPDIPMAYFAPCHQREQDIGQPYFEILKSVPNADIVRIGEAMECCGMGGHLGYKDNFHDHSLAIGKPVFDKLSKEPHRTLITDCLSCRLQFQQVLPGKTFHPVEILEEIHPSKFQIKEIGQ
jgi:glycerol-3-phosphate dehydrogenase subunit C